MDTEFEAIVAPMKHEALILPEWVTHGDTDEVLERLAVNDDSRKEFIASSARDMTVYNRAVAMLDQMVEIQKAGNEPDPKHDWIRKAKNYLFDAKIPSLSEVNDQKLVAILKEFDAVMDAHVAKLAQYAIALSRCVELKAALALRTDLRKTKVFIDAQIYLLEVDIAWSHKTFEILNPTEKMMGEVRKELRMAGLIPHEDY